MVVGTGRLACGLFVVVIQACALCKHSKAFHVFAMLYRPRCL